jgi:CBS domain-containing protein
MKVQEIMSPHVECTRPDAPLQQVAERMKSLDIGSLPVCQDDRLVGMITDRDIVVRSVSEGHDPGSDHVADIMSPDVVYCFADQNVEHALQLMRKHHVRRLPVLDRSKHLVGILSLADLEAELAAPAF